MTNWLCSRESVKRALNYAGETLNELVDESIQQMSDQFVQDTNRHFIPYFQTRYYQWPPIVYSSLYRLHLDEDLLAVPSGTILVRSQDPNPSTLIVATGTPDTDIWLEPVNAPPYRDMLINLARNQVFDPGTAWQRSIQIAGMWGYSQLTRSAGKLVGDLSDSQLSLICSDGSLIDVGNTVLIDSEQLFIQDRLPIDSMGTLTADLTKEQNVQVIPVSDGTLYHRGEVVQIDAEYMLIRNIIANSLMVKRSFDNTLGAAHTSGAPIYVFRELVLVRESLDPTSQMMTGLNGTTPALHLNNAPIRVYVPDSRAERCVKSDAIVFLIEEKHVFGRSIGQGGGERQWDARWYIKNRDEICEQLQYFQMASA